MYPSQLTIVCLYLYSSPTIDNDAIGRDKRMNTQTLILTVLIFWLIMGLAFLSAYSEVKRTGGTLVDAMRNNESFFFIISIVVGLVVVAFKLA
ncbi:hypothetical protein DSCW_15550 [Desulfosarcina widdelii]|uniref:Uncharacterized protein n=2 Tax=Desulfosarcina widdelii TaxID=947919 RepID=A0A5K7YZT4_9BACT|nr:hypothetical protein DSCW_15550 [Desulfosarcina widdelii]